MKKKNILVTGSSYGIGFGIAKNFDDDNYNIIITSRNIKKLILAKKKFKTKNIFSYKCNFEEEKSVINLFKKIKKKFQNLDIIICNVGSGRTAKSGEENLSIWKKMFNKNFYSTTNVIENYIKTFKRKNNTKIIVIGSIAGNFRGGAPLSYSLSKNCLLNYVNQISPMLIKKKISINSISPGHVLIKGNNWDQKLKINKNKVKKIINNTVSLKRFCTIEDINNCINFILSKKSNYINGVNIDVDGKTK